MTAGSNQLVVECGPLTSFSPEFQEQLADELSNVGPDTAIANVIRRYGLDRDDIRACIEASRTNG